MKILLQYFKPYRGLILLTMVLAAINMCFSLIDPIILGNLTDLANKAWQEPAKYDSFLWSFAKEVLKLLGLSVGVAMVSRIAKAFQDYFLNLITQKFGAAVFTQGLQHAMKLPYQEFEDQRSGETLSILTKVRADMERFFATFINVLFPVIVGIVFVAVYATTVHWSLPIIYFGGIFLLIFISNLLSKKK